MSRRDLAPLALGALVGVLLAAGAELVAWRVSGTTAPAGLYVAMAVLGAVAAKIIRKGS